MKNDIVKFDYESKEIRTLTDENEETWFTGIDVCNILEYSNATQAIEKLDEDERKLDYVIDSSGQRRKTWMINESGLYALILTSTKPEAKKFRKWITGTVLPSIRKAGKYTTDQAQAKELDLQRFMNEIERVESVISDYKSKIKELNVERETFLYELRQLIRSNPNQLKLDLDQE
jgi:prophage antirepressor-like protein